MNLSLVSRVVRNTLRVGMLLALAGASGCFSLKEPPCAFTCLEPPHRCPENYTCQADGLCHREGASNACGLTPPNDAGGIDLNGDRAADAGAADDAGDARTPGDAVADSANGAVAGD